MMMDDDGDPPQDDDGDGDGDSDGDVDPPQDDNLMTCAEMRSSGELGSQEATSPSHPVSSSLTNSCCYSG